MCVGFLDGTWRKSRQLQEDVKAVPYSLSDSESRVIHGGGVTTLGDMVAKLSPDDAVVRKEAMTKTGNPNHFRLTVHGNPPLYMLKDVPATKD